jgi:DNA invertase Pin-like site-specific DNA recombinase
VVHDAEETRGKLPSRPAFACARTRLSRGDATLLLVTDLGRLCRSVADLGEVLAVLDRVGARLVSLRPEIDTGTELGRSAAGIVAQVSAWERERRAERSRKGLAAARARGALRPAIDYELKRRIERMRNAGMTLQAIVDELNDAGVPTVRGGAKWRPSSVQAAIGYKRPAHT